MSSEIQSLLKPNCTCINGEKLLFLSNQGIEEASYQAIDGNNYKINKGRSDNKAPRSAFHITSSIPTTPTRSKNAKLTLCGFAAGSWAVCTVLGGVGGVVAQIYGPKLGLTQTESDTLAAAIFLIGFLFGTALAIIFCKARNNRLTSSTHSKIPS
ncbi:hypothetical protein D5018_07985 [Parashewanella curva]|uniref:Uncharacterized protein n=1 Tax=Parashewanella curva TaxID=2338552 RepID=A0A3L8PXK5_9GAMM|nr:hypothetical protein [Parashewanella curva]RLV60197.1 hypothetical protein D5018_07985 [Parashewanella curva]